MYIEIIRYLNEEKLQRKVWVFYFSLNNVLSVRLDSFKDELRHSRRHRIWNLYEHYDRIFSRSSTISSPYDVCIPDDVFAEAKELVVVKIKNLKLPEAKP